MGRDRGARFTNEANTLTDAPDRLQAAKEAINVIDTALQSYPTEQSLLESREVLREMAVSIRVTDLG
jgi:hypothetical protein